MTERFGVAFFRFFLRVLQIVLKYFLLIFINYCIKVSYIDFKRLLL